MSGRKIATLFAWMVLGSQSVQAQDLSVYDPNNYSGGYAEGAYAPVGDEQLYPFDSQDQWQHGYIQYMPFYGAYHHFRPYNYKHVVSQTQTAAGWGMSPRMPYSQQFWHRYHSHAKMSHPASGAYETYLNVEPTPPVHPVPPHAMPQGEEMMPAPRPVPQRIPEPPTPELGSPELPNSVYYVPQGQDHLSAAAYRQQAGVPQSQVPVMNGGYMPASSHQPVLPAYPQQPILLVP